MPDPMQSLSPEQQAAAEAVMQYFQVMDEARSDVEGSLQPLADITDGNMRTMSMETIERPRSKGLKQEGPIRYEITEVAPPTEQDGEVSVVVYACSDATNGETIDVNTNMPAEGVTRIDFITYELTAADRHGWKLYAARSEKAESCP